MATEQACKSCGRMFFTTDPDLPCPNCQAKAVPVQKIQLVGVSASGARSYLGQIDGRQITTAQVTACQECGFEMAPGLAKYSPLSGKLVCGGCLASGTAQRAEEEQLATAGKIRGKLMYYAVMILVAVGVMYALTLRR